MNWGPFANDQIVNPTTRNTEVNHGINGFLSDLYRCGNEDFENVCCTQGTDQPNLTRTLQPRDFRQLGGFTELYAGSLLGMGCTSIGIRRFGEGDSTSVEVSMPRAADARPFQVPGCQMEVGNNLRYTLSERREPGSDNPVLVFENVQGMTHPDDDGVRRNITRMEIRRTAGGGLEYSMTLQGQRDPVVIRFQNTLAYDGFRDQLRRIREMRP